jgi:hypothetical protein
LALKSGLLCLLRPSSALPFGARSADRHSPSPIRYFNSFILASLHPPTYPLNQLKLKRDVARARLSSISPSLLISTGNSPSFSFLFERACTPPHAPTSFESGE